MLFLPMNFIGKFLSKHLIVKVPRLHLIVWYYFCSFTVRTAFANADDICMRYIFPIKNYIFSPFELREPKKTVELRF